MTPKCHQNDTKMTSELYQNHVKTTPSTTTQKNKNTKKFQANTIQSVSQPASQPVNQSVCRSVSQSISQSVSQPASQSVSQSISQSINQSVSQPASQSVSQSASQSVSQSASQSTHPSTDHFVRARWREGRRQVDTWIYTRSEPGAKSTSKWHWNSGRDMN